MNNDKAIVLETKNLNIGYPESNQTLFESLNLSLKLGELVCFMGPNGVGKSTLIRTLARLQKPISGEINITGADQETSLSQHVSVVLTDRLSSMSMTVYELITFGRYPYLDWSVKLSEHDKKVIDNAIDHLRLHSLINKKIYELSDGQFQMTMIARALAQDTPIILLDEPTAHLDLNNRVEIMKLLRDLTRSTNKAILVSTHDLDLALQTSDSIWLTSREKNIVVGIPEDLVLNGKFDEVFQFKGFDLKTGKVKHQATRKLTFTLNGEGFEYLWTKNALERNGYLVVKDQAHYRVTVKRKDEAFEWVVNESLLFKSLSDLLNLLPEMKD
jgi:iron complex transport system ATP-binding protein